jgi:periplasmic protein CpxP/Spy
MKNIMEKRVFRAAAVLLCTGGLMVGAAMAQQDAPPPPDGAMQGPPAGGPGRGGPERRLDMLQKHLGLSGDQTAQVKTILDGERSKTEALRSNTSLTEQDRRAQFMAIHKDEDAKINAVLTADQKTKFDAMESHGWDRRRGGPGGPPPADAPQPPAASPQQ